jgi:hypothetical protein
MDSVARECLRNELPSDLFGLFEFTHHDPRAFPADWIGKFDVILVTDMHLFQEDHLIFLKNLSEMLKVGGHLLILRHDPANLLHYPEGVDIDLYTRSLYIQLFNHVSEMTFSALGHLFPLISIRRISGPCVDLVGSIYEKTKDSEE